MWTKTWRYRLEEDFRYVTPLLIGITFENEWISIQHAEICIKKGYAWDGCSPAIQLKLGNLLPQGLWFGTWDGPIETNARPVSYRASLVHDALCQFRGNIEISKKTATAIFKEILLKDKAPRWQASIYPVFVACIGPQNWRIK